MELVQQNGEPVRTLAISTTDNNIVLDMVKKAVESVKMQRFIQSLTMSVIRYCPAGTNPCIGSCFPPHIDHCNDGSWVVLFSLGCTANFHIKSPGMPQKESIVMKSGDVLVFDPSSEAAILHGVDSIENDGGTCRARWTEFGENFEVLCNSRFGVQCRVHSD